MAIAHPRAIYRGQCCAIATISVRSAVNPDRSRVYPMLCAESFNDSEPAINVGPICELHERRAYVPVVLGVGYTSYRKFDHVAVVDHAAAKRFAVPGWVRIDQSPCRSFALVASHLWRCRNRSRTEMAVRSLHAENGEKLPYMAIHANSGGMDGLGGGARW